VSYRKIVKGFERWLRGGATRHASGRLAKPLTRDLMRQRTSVQERSSQTRGPSLQNYASGPPKIPTQCGDIRVGADAIEPFEHDRHILALLASRGDRDFLIGDQAAYGVREDFRLLLAG
jgi:hypothetical protein